MSRQDLALAGPADSREARDRVVRALHADLIGPFQPDAGAVDGQGEAVELLPLPPSRWYLTGFLACTADRGGAPNSEDPTAETEDADFGAGDDVASDDEGDPDPEPKRTAFFPSSLGMSLILPPARAGRGEADSLRVTVCWADYVREDTRRQGEAGEAGEDEGDDAGERRRYRWRRLAERAETVVVELSDSRVEVEVPDSGGLRVQSFAQPSDAPGLVPGSRAVALFLVNGRATAPPGRHDESYIFQVRLEVRASCGLVARPDLRDAMSDSWDAKVADLQFRGVFEWAVGHGVAVESAVDADGQRVVKTTWIPRATVPRVVHRLGKEVETGMEALASLADGAAAEAALRPLVTAYGQWIERQTEIEVGRGVSTAARARREATRDSLVGLADRVRQRIEGGIALLASRPEALEAFKRANRAMADAAKKRHKAAPGGEAFVPSWRLFQLAFILVNLEGVSDDAHPDRDNVELIFFPTGGGKTEAYLGLIAYVLVLRRLTGRSRPDQGLGTAVILRYTLRLLTLDQLGRAATLVCALELQRRELDKALKPGKNGVKPANPLGDVRFAIGLWVGRAATANTIGQIARDMVKYEGKKAEVFPLTECPWCQEAIAERSIELKPSVKAPEEVVVSCAKWSCEFSAKHSGGDGLPVLFVDEQIYRELPSFVIATVDKYAMTPWRGEVGMLFGRATARLGKKFFGAMDKEVPVEAERLLKGLPPPELVVQDELHLISGPLGTMTGLYETAIEHLMRYRGEDGRWRVPKIVASTATVREATRHVQALFGRKNVSVFPPQGIDPNETFFSQVAAGDAGRDYVGVAASGRRMKQVLLRTYVALLAAGGRWYRDKGGVKQAVDPYMTLVGYFNSLRELGGMRRLVEDEVRTRCLSYAERMPMGVADNPHMGNRKLEMPIELTSRESTQRVKVAKDRLHYDRAAEGGVDVLLASNMISVGVDIDRLGLMVMAGQPKTTAEYIQATSRVGRDARRPGLVVTCFNLYKARDRSHYEHFETYHASFYRRVEAGSLTPFSGPALDRGLAGVLVGMVRHERADMAPSAMVMEVAAHRAGVAAVVVDAIVERAKAASQLGHDGAEEMAATLRKRLNKLLDSWEGIVEEARQAATERRYSEFDRGGKGRGLLVTAMDLLQEDQPGAQPRTAVERRFQAPTSMRDVEPSVHVYVDRKPAEEAS
jgi:hypothetical protein